MEITPTTELWIVVEPVIGGGPVEARDLIRGPIALSQLASTSLLFTSRAEAEIEAKLRAAAWKEYLEKTRRG